MQEEKSFKEIKDNMLFNYSMYQLNTQITLFQKIKRWFKNTFLN